MPSNFSKISSLHHNLNLFTSVQFINSWKVITGICCKKRNSLNNLIFMWRINDFIISILFMIENSFLDKNKIVILSWKEKEGIGITWKTDKILQEFLEDSANRFQLFIKNTQKYVIILSYLIIKLTNCSQFSNSHHVALEMHSKEESVGYYRVYFVRVIQLCDWGIVREGSDSQKLLM